MTENFIYRSSETEQFLNVLKNALPSVMTSWYLRKELSCSVSMQPANWVCLDDYKKRMPLITFIPEEREGWDKIKTNVVKDNDLELEQYDEQTITSIINLIKMSLWENKPKTYFELEKNFQEKNWDMLNGWDEVNKLDYKAVYNNGVLYISIGFTYHGK